MNLTELVGLLGQGISPPTRDYTNTEKMHTRTRVSNGK
jgi:hypothetical protein